MIYSERGSYQDTRAICEICGTARLQGHRAMFSMEDHQEASDDRQLLSPTLKR
jgi:hypothetical protein